MTSLSYLKGVKTRYRNILQTEIQNGSEILSTEITPPDEQQYVLRASKCAEKLQMYVGKLEIQSDKVACVMEEQGENIDNVIEEDCSLCSRAMDYFLDLNQFKERLVEFIKLEKEEEKKSVIPSEIIDLQREIKDILKFQIEQKEIERVKETVERVSVRLPKLDLISFNGEKSRWIEFWDSFESSVHKNKHLSNVEKFNYLKCKLQGEAKRAISGITLSNDNYKLAVNILEERFGNKQDMIDLHYNEMINLFPAMNRTASLRDFLDKVKRHLRSLEVLNQDVNQDVFISIVKSKLPEEVLLQLEIQKGAQEKWTITNLCDKLKDYVIAREKSCVVERPRNVKQQPQNVSKFNSSTWQNKPFLFKRNGYNNKPPLVSAEALVVSTGDKRGTTYFDKCRYCGERHWSDECKKYQTIDERKRKLKGCCFNCLREGHSSKECKRSKLCVHCNETNLHHRSLCPKKFKLKSTSVHLSEELGVNSYSDIEFSDGRIQQNSLQIRSSKEENVLITSSEMVLMQTAKTDVRNTENSYKQTTRVLFDSGSQRTYISQGLAQRLKLKCEQEEEIKLVTFGSEKAKIVKTWSTRLNIKLKNGKYFCVMANIVPVISGSVQRRKLDGATITHLKQFVSDIELADEIPVENESSCVDLLIGNDYYLDLILSQRIEVQPGLYLLASKLGWIITGRTHDSSMNEDETSLLILSHVTNEVISGEQSVTPKACRFISQPDLTDFWNLESIGISDNYEQSDDERAMKLFKETLKFQDGRYQVTWPWKEDEPDLPLNRSLALGRLKSCIDRLKKRPLLLKRYDSVIQDQLKKGIIEKVTEKDGNLVHYIPHHAVITPHKSTTKLRIVYDASSKVNKDVKSLNECLYRGPVMLNNLCGMMMRFRLHKVGLVADIEKAFLQVGLQKSERDVTRFLWIKDADKVTVNIDNIEEYRFCRVPFGVISSPFLLGSTIDYHLSTSESPVANKIRGDIYVDNLITGASSVTEGISVYLDSKKIFRQASMNLREWISNDRDVNNFIPDEDDTGISSTKVLGHVWNVDTDTLSLKPTHSSVIGGKQTKRTTLKYIAEVFDPLGLFSPVIIQGKVLLQDLWKKRLNWDDELMNEDICRWREIYSQLLEITECQIPRCIVRNTVSEKCKLLCFCDASACAYATAVYLHQVHDGFSQCDLVFSKTRLAPVKGMTIPRLELMAVLIGIRSLKYVESELKIPIEGKFLWSDSQCVLKWISTNKDLGVFVRNRVTEIKKNGDVKFEYIPTNENPADVATRGTSTKKLTSNRLWWHGPVWLNCEEIYWKHFLFNDDESVKRSYQSEIRKAAKESISHLIASNDYMESVEEAPYGIQSDKYSSFIRLIRVTGWIIRFINRLRKSSTEPGKELTSKELQSATIKWCKYVQNKNFSDVFRSISSGKGSNFQRQLGVYIGADGLLRCTGRLENADLSEGAKFPILLPRGERFTDLLIQHIHYQQLHCGVSQTLCQIRYNYWIPQGRSAVRKVLRNCLVCRKHEGGPYKMPMMAPYPKSRVSQSIPFSGTGLDYLGPILVNHCGETRKRWICLFTCVVTRAVHLELLQDMTTEEFLYGFRRFISTRGTPTQIISDNASQFKLGGEIVHSVWKGVIRNGNVQSYISNLGIHWKFITELAPWMGGFYERLVGLVKRSLRKTLNRKLLSEVQLHTTVKEIEAVVNSRPLVYVGDDINSRITLTPSQFLCLNPNLGVPEIDCNLSDPTFIPYTSNSEKLLKLWKKGQKLLDVFWKMWREDYLMSLRERMQTYLKDGKVHSSFSPDIGDVVIIKDDIPRGLWKLGRIFTLIPGKDRKIRTAKIQLASGKVIGRPLNLLYPLETGVFKNETVPNKSPTNDSICDNKCTRRSAEKAKEKIKEYYSE